MTKICLNLTPLKICFNDKTIKIADFETFLVFSKTIRRVKSTFLIFKIDFSCKIKDGTVSKILDNFLALRGSYRVSIGSTGIRNSLLVAHSANFLVYTCT